jgi:hypothetical protein
MASTDARALAKMAKVKVQMDEKIAAGRFYEAQQLYQSLFNRHSARGQHAEAAALMETGATQLLEQKQGNAGGELAQLLIQAYKKMGQRASTAAVATVRKIFAAFPQGAGTDGATAQRDFIKQAIAWSIELPPQDEAGFDDVELTSGHPLLHADCASMFLTINAERKEPDYAKATRHLLRANDVAAHSAVLFQWSHLHGFAGERDLFIARVVMQYIALQNLRGANAIFLDFLQRWKNAEEELQSPLINFLRLLLACMERDALPLFEMLRQRYKTELQRDEDEFAKLLDTIGNVYFGIPLPKDMLSELFSS